MELLGKLNIHGFLFWLNICFTLHTSTSPGCQCGEGGGRHSQCVPGVPVRGEQDGELTQCGSREPA